jgi:hypothetical protein
MKKKIGLTFLLFVAGITALTAQHYEKAIGLRAGTMLGASYKQFFHTAGAYEAILDMDILHSGYMSLRGTFLYEYHFLIHSIDGLSWYIGPGATIGVRIGDGSAFLLGIDIISGLEYKFSTTPLCLSLDVDPKFYFVRGANNDLFSPNAALTLRYTF